MDERVSIVTQTFSESRQTPNFEYISIPRIRHRYTLSVACLIQLQHGIVVSSARPRPAPFRKEQKPFSRYKMHPFELGVGGNGLTFMTQYEHRSREV